jgi:hypothetical protein
VGGAGIGFDDPKKDGLELDVWKKLIEAEMGGREVTNKGTNEVRKHIFHTNIATLLLFY